MYGDPFQRSGSSVPTSRARVPDTIRIDTSVTGDFVLADEAPAEEEAPKQEAPRMCGTGCGCSRIGPGPSRSAWTVLAAASVGGFGTLIALYWFFVR